MSDISIKVNIAGRTYPLTLGSAEEANIRKAEETIDAVVKKITPYGVFVILSESKLEAKLTIDDNISTQINNGEIALEKTIRVKIKHLTGDRIVIEAP
jgi:hypothetical protein